MENNIILKNLIEKKNIEYKKMNDLDEQWFNDKIDFETSMKIRQEYEKHKNKYFFYKNLIEQMRKGE